MHHTPIKVRGYHLDLYGHVNNARYLEFLEEARWAYFEPPTAWNGSPNLAWPWSWSISTSTTAARPSSERATGGVHRVKSLSNRSAVIHQRITLDRYEHGGREPTSPCAVR